MSATKSPGFGRMIDLEQRSLLQSPHHQGTEVVVTFVSPWSCSHQTQRALFGGHMLGIQSVDSDRHDSLVLKPRIGYTAANLKRYVT